MIKAIEKDGDILIVDVETDQQIMRISSVDDDEVNNLFFYLNGGEFLKMESGYIADYEFLFIRNRHENIDSKNPK